MRSDRSRLRDKADRFLSRRSAARREVVAFADELLEMGPTVVIGGLLRDLHLDGSRAFRSDVDFAVHPATLADFDRFAARHGGVANRFGGVAMRRGRWNVDVWPLQRTWARVAGHRRIERIEDLVEATFFDWDAVVYDVGGRTILARPGSLEAMRGRILGISLHANPNPFGNAVRALRYAVRYRAALAPELAEHVSGQIRDRGWSAMLAAERASFTHRVLERIEGGERLAEALSGPGPVSIALRECQGRLFATTGPDPSATGAGARDPRRRPVMRPYGNEMPFG